MSQAQTHRVQKLAKRIEADIRRRDLRPGDPYLKTSEVAQMLRVSKQAANHAMQLLAQRKLIDRRQRSGTSIAELTPDPSRQPIDSVMMLVHQSYLRTEGLLADGVVVGLAGRLPGVHVKFAYTPSLDDGAFVAKIVGQCLKDKSPTGLLLVRSSLNAQRLVAESGLPAVIYGTPQPSITTLSSIDNDQREAGRRLALLMIENGHRRLAVFLRDRIFPGDRLFQDGIREVAAEHGLAVGDLITRSIPIDNASIVAETAAVLASSKKLPGIIARTETIAHAASQAVIDAGLRVGEDVTVAIAQIYRRGNENLPPLPFMKTELSPEGQGQEIARLLCLAATGGPVEHVDLPMRLAEPSIDLA